MLDQVSIRGFRIFDELKLEGTGKYNIIVGPNNSGKSSLLESLYLHCSPLNFGALLHLLSFRNGGFQTNQSHIFEQISWFFTNKAQHETEIEITGKWNDITRKTIISIADYSINQENITTIFPIQENDGIKIGTIYFSFESDNQKETRQEIDFFSSQKLQVTPPKIRPDIAASLSNPFLHKTPGAGVERYSKVVKKGYYKKCLELIQKTIDADIEDISILMTSYERPELFVTHKKIGRMPITVFGDGMRRMLLIALSIVECEKGILFIDEIESAMHFNALKGLADWIFQVAEELDIQIFATTHSLECVDAILASNIAQMDQITLFKIGLYKNQMNCNKITGNVLKYLRYEMGQDVRGLI